MTDPLYVQLQQLRMVLPTTAAIARAPTQDLPRIGAALWALSSRIKDLAEAAKDALRQHVPAAPGQYLVQGPGATGMVTVQAPQPVLRKEVNPEQLRAALGDDFGRLFEVTILVTPRESFERAVQEVKDPGRVQIALAAVDLATPKPRVSFQLTGVKAQDPVSHP